MATGGFKAFEYNWTAHAVSTDATTIGGYVKALLKGITQGIVGTNSNWGYDSNFTATADDYIKIGTSTTTVNQIWAQCLINSVSGAKLLVYFNPGWKMPHDVSQIALPEMMSSSPYYRRCAGLCMSMIPGGVNESWNTDSSGNLSIIPQHGTGLIGTANCYNSVDSTSTSTSGYKFTCLAYGVSCRYVLTVKDDLISVMWQTLNSGNINGMYYVGKIFGQLCNSSDDDVCSEYGAFSLVPSNFTGREDQAPNFDTNYYCINSRDKTQFIRSTSCSMTFFYKDSTDAFNRSSLVVPSAHVTNEAATVGTVIQSASTNTTAFSPLLICGAISNSYTGAVPGNGFKGYLNTDLIRMIYYGFPYNTLLDNGKFIYVGGAVAVGWDASNTVILRT